MAQITRSDPRLYPASGTASAAALGISAASGLTFAPLPYPAHPQMTANAPYGACSDVGASCSFRVDGTGVPLGGSFSGNPTYCAGAWIFAEIADPVAFAAGATVAFTAILTQNGGGANFQAIMQMQLGTVNPLDTSWLAISAWNASDLTGDGLCETGACRQMGTYPASTSTPNVGAALRYAPASQANFGFGQWGHVGVYSRVIGGTDLHRGLIINGQAVAYHIQTGTSYNAVHSSGWTVTLPAIPGVRWWIVEPESWSGTDWPKANTHFNSPDNVDLAFGYPTPVAGSQVGAPWAVSSSGTISVDVTTPLYTLTGGGNNPRDRDAVQYGSAGATRTKKLTRNLGNLPFNKKGWFTLYLPMLQPRAKSYTVSFRNAGDTADVFTLKVNEVANVVSLQSHTGEVGSVTFANLSGRRVKPQIHVSASGIVTMTVHTSDHWTGTTAATNNSVRSCAVGRWTPQALGPVSIVGTGDNTEVQEHMGVIGLRRNVMGLPDSYIHADTTGLDGSADHKAQQTFEWQNAMYPYSCMADGHLPAWVHFYKGSRYTHIGPPIGRTGHKITESVTSVLPNLQYTRGSVVVIKGGFPNDTTTASTAALADSVSRTIAAAFAAWAAWAAATDNELIVEKPPKGNDASMTGGFPGACFDRAFVLVQRALEPYIATGVVTIVPQFAATIAALHPTTTEAQAWGLFSKAGSRAPVANKLRRRDRRANIGKKTVV